jgi:hypothetical protein
MVNEDCVPLSTAVIAGLPPPIVRDWLTVSPLVLENVIVD